jgi:Xaa-Pro dipeptidase
VFCNLPRALDYMRRSNLDAIVATTPVNVNYLSDYFCWLDPIVKEYFFEPGAPSYLRELYALLPVQGDPALVITPPFAMNAADAWVKDVRIYGDPGFDFSQPVGPLSDTARRFHELMVAPVRDNAPLDALVSALKDRGLAEGRIGVEMEGLAPERQEALRRALPKATVKDCSNLIRLVRMVKSVEELARITRAHEICEAAARSAFALARPGMPVAALQQHYRAHLAESGADYDHFSYGYEGLGIGHEPAYCLKSDDVLYIDYAGAHGRYYGDSGATLAMKEPPASLRHRYDALRDCVDAAATAVRPGAPASSVCAEMWKVLEARGVTRLFPHGHGIGLECRDYPIIVPKNNLRIRDDCVDVGSDLPLETDMVLEIEAGMFVPGVGSLNVERAFHVTADGCRPLIAQEREQPFLVAGS